MTTVEVKLTFHEDAGHGWLEVPVNLLPALGLTPGDFSECSFISKDEKAVFLEEDCDAPKFDHHAKKAGWKVSSDTNLIDFPKRFGDGPHTLLATSRWRVDCRHSSGVFSRGGYDEFYAHVGGK